MTNPSYRVWVCDPDRSELLAIFRHRMEARDYCALLAHAGQHGMLTGPYGERERY